MKALLNKMFHEPDTKIFIVANDILAFLTITSVLALVLETVVSLAPYEQVFHIIEYTAVSFFTVEYLARIYISERKGHYLFGFFGVVDLMAILPSYLLLTNLTFLKAARVLHVVRFLRMVRLVKLVHATERPHGWKGRAYDQIQKLNLQIYFFSLFSAVIIFGTLLFLFEGNTIEATNIPIAMVWIAKVIMGGVAQSVPTTIWGDLTVIMTRFTGLLLFGLLIHLVGEYVNKLLLGTAASEPIQSSRQINKQ